MAADAAIVTLALSRSGAETGTHNPTERKRTNEQNKQAVSPRQVAKAAAKFGAAR